MLRQQSSEDVTMRRQRHKASGEVWQRVANQGAVLTGPSTVRIQRDGKQRVVWLAYWRDDETWGPVE